VKFTVFEVDGLNAVGLSGVNIAVIECELLDSRVNGPMA
jgi:hypothetical protein